MSEKSRPWTPQEDMIAIRMKADRSTPLEIADAIHRTRGAVSSRLSYLGLTPAARTQKRREKRGGPKRQPTVIRQRATQSSMRFVPQEVLKDRERRELAPRDITATLMGDPTFCRSGLALKSQDTAQ